MGPKRKTPLKRNFVGLIGLSDDVAAKCSAYVRKQIPVQAWFSLEKKMSRVRDFTLNVIIISPNIALYTYKNHCKHRELEALELAKASFA